MSNSRTVFITDGVVKDNNIPADLYYACYSGSFNWDKNGNGLYGEVNAGISFTPSVYVTRIPVRTNDDVNAFSSKLFSYERSFRKPITILMAGAQLATNNAVYPQEAEAKGDELFNNYINPYRDGSRFKFYDTGTSFTGGAAYDVTTENMISQLSKGYSFVDMITHGRESAWGLENNNTYESENAKSQINSSYTIIATMACNTNAFDVSEAIIPCLSECLIRNPNSGVIAYLGCSRLGFYDRSSLGTSLNYEAQYYKRLFSKDIENKNWGVIVSAAKLSESQKCFENGSNRWVQFGLNPIGDPEMPIYTDTPKVFETARFTTKGNCVYIDTHVAGCRICIMSKEDFGESYYKVYEDEQNICIENIPDNCNICVTKQGYIPTEYTLRQFQAETINSGNIEANVVIIGAGVNTSEQIGSVNIMGENTVISAGTVIIEDGTFISKTAGLTIK